MSILPVLPLVQAYNKDKASLFDTSRLYEPSEEDNKRLLAIFTAVQLIKTPYEVTLKLCRASGQLYLQCKEKPLKLPPIR
jgi:hypothetical protein